MENLIQQLVKEYFDALRMAFINFIRQSYPLNGDEITDIYNDVWMDVIENVRSGRTERVKNWKTYIFNLGWKRAYKIVTRRTVCDKLDDSENCCLGLYTFSIQEAEQSACHMEHLERIEKLMVELEGLPKKQQEVLRLYYFQDLSTAEIAEALGYTGSRSVITMKKRSVSTLRERMKAA